MSRVGRQPIEIPAGVTVTVTGSEVNVGGPLGNLKQTVDKKITVNVEGNEVIVTRLNDTPECKAKHGLYRQLIANMVKGVKEGFSKSLIINGVGYKAIQQGDKVSLSLGLSHPVVLTPEGGIKLTVKAVNELVVSGIDRAKVGQYAAMVRDKRPVEPYHAYGIRYSDEVVVKKQGKTSGKGKK
jgi:large subunit ribosomal protein L6